MSATVAINGLTITHRGSGGKHSNSAPDICRTGGGTPVPYSITAVNPDIDQGTQKVFADGGNMIAIKPSIYTRCSGDESGVGRGVVSGTHLKRSHWITYSPNVYAEGENICRLSDKLFMNDRNTISGTGGQQESPVRLNDPLLDELCNIFCQTRDEWHQCLASKPRKECKRPSHAAKTKTRAALERPGSALNRAVGQRLPGGFGAAERTLYAAADRALDMGRKFYDEGGIKKALRRAVAKAAGKVAVDRAQKVGKRIWLKLVPGLNVLSTALDAAMTAADIYELIEAASSVLDDAIRIQPDFTLLDKDGVVDQIYDFKFDGPPDYQDSMPEDQRRRYASVANKQPIPVDDATCKCDARLSRPMT